MTSVKKLVLSLGALELVWPDCVSVIGARGAALTPKERRTWQQLVRATYGKQALKAGFAIFGRALTLTDLAHIVENASEWESRVREGAGLAPLLAAFVKTHQLPPDDFKGLRDSALSRGLSALSWKWLFRQRTKAVSKLFAFGWTPEAIWWANLLAKARGASYLHPNWLENGRPYMQQGVYEWVIQGCTPLAWHTTGLQVERFFRLVPVAVNARALTEYEIVSSAFMAGLRNPERVVSVAPGRTWENLLITVRRYNDEREARAQQLARAQGTPDASLSTHFKWHARIGAGHLHNVQVSELLCEQDLKAEGSVMEHCVGNGTYLQGCALGNHTVLSLREPLSKARATLQLVHSERTGTWCIGQLSGPSNATVPQLFWKVARELAAGIKPLPSACSGLLMASGKSA